MWQCHTVHGARAHQVTKLWILLSPGCIGLSELALKSVLKSSFLLQGHGETSTVAGRGKRELTGVCPHTQMFQRHEALEEQAGRAVCSQWSWEVWCVGKEGRKEQCRRWVCRLGPWRIPALLLTYYRAFRELFNLAVDQFLNEQNSSNNILIIGKGRRETCIGVRHSKPRAIGEGKDGRQVERNGSHWVKRDIYWPWRFCFSSWILLVKSAEPTKGLWGLELQVWLKVTECSSCVGTTQNLPWSSKGAPGQMDTKFFLSLDLVHDGGN